MTKLWTKALLILVLVAPAGLIPADKKANGSPEQTAAITENPTRRNAQLRGKPSEPFTLFPGGNAFGLSPNPLNETVRRVKGQARLVTVVKE